MILRRLILICASLLFLLSACAQNGDAAGTPTDTVTLTPTTQALPTQTAPATAVPLPTVTPEPTPVRPSITTSLQPLTEDGRLTIDSVVAAEAGWLVLLSDKDGAAGDILGYSTVVPGENQALTVEIEPQAATPLLHARLHRDAGDAGEFEFPGPDTAVELRGTPVVADLELDIQLPIPQIEVTDQEVTADGMLRIDSILAVEPGWLVVHSLQGDEIGPALGQISLPAGTSSDVMLPIRWREASTTLLAMLYEDQEQPGGFDDAQDLPVVVGGAPVSEEFTVTLPPDISIYDQPVIDGRIIAERVISPGPGWVVVYTTEEEQPGIIIGFAPLTAGVNELVSIEIVETAVTPQLFLLLHEESSDPAEFNFPAADLPASYNDQLIPPFAMITTPGNYVVTTDQTLGEKDEIVVPLVVTDLASWLVIYETADDGSRGEIIGELWLPAGINRDNKVELRARPVDEPLLAVLHQDAGVPQEFDYPDGDDLPLQRNRQIIQAPFTLSEPSTTSAFSPGS